MIRHSCTRCQRELESPDEMVDKALKCPDCGAWLTVPQKAAGRLKRRSARPFPAKKAGVASRTVRVRTWMTNRTNAR